MRRWSITTKGTKSTKTGTCDDKIERADHFAATDIERLIRCSLSSAVTGLAPATLYHCRIVVTSGTYSVNGADMAFVTTRATPSTEVGAQGGVAPLISGSARFLSFGSPAISYGNSDHWAFQALLTGTGIAKTNNSGIWLLSSSTTDLIARTGDPAPGGGVFATLRDPVLNNHNHVAFLGTLSGTGYGSKNNLGIWSDTSGTLTLVAQTNGQPLDSTGVKASSFLQVVLPDDEGVVFLANLVKGTGGTTGADNQGIWAVDTGGNLRLIIRKGDTLMVNGTPKIVASLSIFTSSLGAKGQSRSFNKAGDLIFKVTFTDKTQAIQKVVFP